MGDEGFDPCECMWNHDLAMRRLLSILRQTQVYCTDNECLTFPRLPGPRDSQPPSNLLMMLMVFGLVFLLYALRPRSLRPTIAADTKSRDNGNDPNDDPPLPPPAAN